MNGIITYVVPYLWPFSLRMFSKFVHVVAHIISTFLFWLNNVPLYGYTAFLNLFIDSWKFGVFLLLLLIMPL